MLWFLGAVFCSCRTGNQFLRVEGKILRDFVWDSFSDPSDETAERFGCFGDDCFNIADAPVLELWEPHLSISL